MSLGISARLRHSKKHELTKSHSQSQVLADKLQQDGIIGTVENVMQAVDRVVTLLLSKSADSKTSYKESIINLCQHMKVYGPYLELLYRDDLNRAFVVFRNSSQDDDKLDYLSRLHLLELIELRAKQWKASDIMCQYYKAKISRHAQIFQSHAHLQTESLEISNEMSDSITSMPPILTAGEVLKSSGKFLKPTRIPGKNYCKDEVVIRNADSGKVMGIKGRRVHMIEELSETVISFQRVNSGSKERLVQITGANEESINHAKQLIEDTIRRNASPVREQQHGHVAGSLLTGSSSSINSSASEDSALPHSANASRTLIHSLSTNDASIGEFKYSVVVGDHVVKITGDNLELVRTCKLVLDEFFTRESMETLDSNFLTESIVRPSNESLLSPPDSLPSPSISSDDAPQIGLRRPRVDSNCMQAEKDECLGVEPLRYSNEYLARLAMSPLCLMTPGDWERISGEFPTLIRKHVEAFDCKSYLSYRFDARNAFVACTSEAESEEA